MSGHLNLHLPHLPHWVDDPTYAIIQFKLCFHDFFAQSFETTEVSRAWQAPDASNVQNNRRGIVHTLSMNRASLDIVVTVFSLSLWHSLSVSLSLGLQLAPAMCVCADAYCTGKVHMVAEQH